MFSSLGFEIEEFGEDSYVIRGVPGTLYGLQEKELFLSVLDDLKDLNPKEAPEIIAEKRGLI